MHGVIVYFASTIFCVVILQDIICVLYIDKIIISEHAEYRPPASRRTGIHTTLERRAVSQDYERARGPSEVQPARGRNELKVYRTQQVTCREMI